MIEPDPCRCASENAECRRAGRPMVGRLYELCSGQNCSAELSARYRAQWDGLPVPRRTITEQPRPAARPQGPGHELSRLLARLGISYTPGCKCRSMAAKMDALGCAWCESVEGMAEILEAMRTEAAKRGLPWLDGVAKMLIRRAVNAARRDQQRAAAKESQAEGSSSAV